MSTRPETGLAIEIARAADATQADWIMLFPAGRVAARDGRSFLNDAPEAVVEAFRAEGLSLSVDVNHAELHRAPKGEGAPAVGWIVELAVREGAIWGRVDWTEEGARMLRAGEYRYVSPLFLAEKATGRVRKLLNAGLVNNPAFVMGAVAARAEETEMELSKLAAAAGLRPDAGADELEAAIAGLRARAAAPDMARFAPRADLDQALARASAAETKLAEREAAAARAAVEEAVDAVIAEGKIAPASRDFYLDACAAQGGLEKFRAAFANAPVVVTPATPAKKPASADHGLTPEEIAVAAAMAIPADEFAKLKETA